MADAVITTRFVGGALDGQKHPQVFGAYFVTPEYEMYAFDAVKLSERRDTNGDHRLEYTVYRFDEAATARVRERRRAELENRIADLERDVAEIDGDVGAALRLGVALANGYDRIMRRIAALEQAPKPPRRRKRKR